MAYRERLLERQRSTGRPVRVGLVGAGQMGRGFVAQVRKIAGMEVVAVADVDLQRATGALKSAGIENVITGDDHDTLTNAVAEGGTVAVNDAALLTALPVDMVIDATGVPEIGAQIALRASSPANTSGCSTSKPTSPSAGCSPAWPHSPARSTPCAAATNPPRHSNSSNSPATSPSTSSAPARARTTPMRPHDTPSMLTDEANRKKMNPKMLASFVDGSKAMIEMAALANAADLGVAKRGLSAYKTTVPELHNVFKPSADGGILDRSGVVDFATGPVAPGVFVVARSDEPTVIEEMDYLGMGEGPYYSFYRPYHLASIEAPLSIPPAVLDGISDIHPRAWRAEVAAGTKRAVKAGETIDGIGGEYVYGMIDSAETAREENLVPLGLLAGARLTRDVDVDHLLTYDDVELDTSTTIYQLRALQDQLLATEPPGTVGPIPGIPKA